MLGGVCRLALAGVIAIAACAARDDAICLAPHPDLSPWSDSLQRSGVVQAFLCGARPGRFNEYADSCREKAPRQEHEAETDERCAREPLSALAHSVPGA